jgi:hypothetical protein
MTEALRHCKLTTFTDEVLAYDTMWALVDTKLWIFASNLDRANERGRTAREYGLFDPNDRNRPLLCETLLREAKALQAAERLKSTPAPAPSPYADNIAVAGPGEKSTTSGHAVLQENNTTREKVKSKGRVVSAQAGPKGPAVPSEVPVGATAAAKKKKKKKKKKPKQADSVGDSNDVDDGTPSADNEIGEDDLRNFPDSLPSEFTTGRKVMEVSYLNRVTGQSLMTSSYSPES